MEGAVHGAPKISGADDGGSPIEVSSVSVPGQPANALT